MSEWVTTTVRAFNEDGYHKDILVIDQQQCRMSEVRIKEMVDGYAIDPKDFPEMVRFTIIVRTSPRR